MAPTLLEELTKMVADFEAASEAARTGRRDHIGARVELEVISAELVEQVKLTTGDGGAVEVVANRSYG